MSIDHLKWNFIKIYRTSNEETNQFVSNFSLNVISNDNVILIISGIMLQFICRNFNIKKGKMKDQKYEWKK